MDGRADRGDYGCPFIHEMAHACQIEHSTHLGFLTSALSSKVCEATGDPYVYGPAGPDWLEACDIEQQAQIVGDWFIGRSPKNGHTNHTNKRADPSSPYFHYIQDYLRIGRW